MDRNLDAEIAEKVYGWVEIPVGKDANGEGESVILFRPDRKPTQDDYNQLPRVGKIGRPWFCPMYTSDYGLAIKFAQEFDYNFSKLKPCTPETIARGAHEHWKEITNNGSFTNKIK